MNNPMFDSIAHTQGGVLHLMDYLWDRYVSHLTERIEERKAEGKESIPLDVALKKTSAQAFKKFCEDFLDENRAVETCPLDENLGFRLSNNDMVALSRGIAIQGSMQDSGAVAVTHGRSQRGNEGVVQVNNTQRI